MRTSLGWIRSAQESFRRRRVLPVFASSSQHVQIFRLRATGGRLQSGGESRGSGSHAAGGCSILNRGRHHFPAVLKPGIQKRKANQMSTAGILRTVFSLACLVAATACGQSDSAAPGAADPPGLRPDLTPDAGEGAALVLTVTPDGNEVRYRVREQLVGRAAENDAVGITDRVSGTLALSAAGRVIPEASLVVVDVEGLTSDQARRDGYVLRRVLEAEQHPTVSLAPTDLPGISLPLPTAGTRTMEMLGTLTIRGVSRPTRWSVTASFADGRVTGTAETSFTFDDFGLTQPRVPIVASVADTIRLEYDFTLVANAPGS
jgi:polyisoprenoid-binding protein YceI